MLQARAVTELFTSQGALTDAGLSHPRHVRREYSSSLRTTVLVLEGDLNRLSLPRVGKTTGLHNCDPIIALQVHAPMGLTCLEVTMSTHVHMGQMERKKVTFSSSRFHPSVMGAHAKLPLALPSSDTWIMITVDLVCKSVGVLLCAIKIHH